MQLFIIILHVMLSFGLIGIILLQPGKDGASVLGGGGGNQMYGPRGSANLLGRATTVVAALFMVTSITLAWMTGVRSTTGNDLDDAIEQIQAEEASPLAPASLLTPTSPEIVPDIPNLPSPSNAEDLEGTAIAPADPYPSLLAPEGEAGTSTGEGSNTP
jgi:preprotein translocase subunit SecG